MFDLGGKAIRQKVRKVESARESGRKSRIFSESYGKGRRELFGLGGKAIRRKAREAELVLESGRESCQRGGRNIGKEKQTKKGRRNHADCLFGEVW